MSGNVNGTPHPEISAICRRRLKMFRAVVQLGRLPNPFHDPLSVHGIIVSILMKEKVIAVGVLTGDGGIYPAALIIWQHFMGMQDAVDLYAPWAMEMLSGLNDGVHSFTGEQLWQWLHEQDLAPNLGGTSGG